jgi:hypothetical protein
MIQSGWFESVEPKILHKFDLTVVAYENKPVASLKLRLERFHHSMMLVTFVQSVIRPYNKDFSPLDERRREKRGNRAENHLLEKSRLHRI